MHSREANVQPFSERGARCAPLFLFRVRRPRRSYSADVSRPTRFEHHRYLGDKRTQVVYDLDTIEEAGLEAELADLLASERFQSFGPDTLDEARNRCYRLHRAQRALSEQA